jgi:molybdate transport system substrate-binding protein
MNRTLMEKMQNKLFTLTALVILILAGCTKPDADLVAGKAANQFAISSDPAASPTTLPVKHTLTVFAAASLTGAFQELARNYESAHPGVFVNLNFAGSQILRTQLEQGAIADIFASADHKNMDVLLTEDLIYQSTFQDFATNQLVVIFPHGNPGNLQELADLATAGMKIVMADESVPAGNYARQVLLKMSQDQRFGDEFRARVLANVVSNETDVKQVVTKVELGEADAGIVYSSDAVAAPELGTITIPENYNVIASYPIAIPDSTNEPSLAADFIVYVTSSEGQAILVKWGFGDMPH